MLFVIIELSDGGLEASGALCRSAWTLSLNSLCHILANLYVILL
jgi:hypothetical protein